MSRIGSSDCSTLAQVYSILHKKESDKLDILKHLIRVEKTSVKLADYYAKNSVDGHHELRDLLEELLNAVLSRGCSCEDE